MSSVIFLILLGMVGSGVSTMAFNWLVLERGPLFAGMTTYVVPVLSLLWGTVDHERITPQQLTAIRGSLRSLNASAAPAAIRHWVEIGTHHG